MDIKPWNDFRKTRIIRYISFISSFFLDKIVMIKKKKFSDLFRFYLDKRMFKILFLILILWVLTVPLAFILYAT